MKKSSNVSLKTGGRSPIRRIAVMQNYVVVVVVIVIVLVVAVIVVVVVGGDRGGTCSYCRNGVGNYFGARVTVQYSTVWQKYNAGCC